MGDASAHGRPQLYLAVDNDHDGFHTSEPRQSHLRAASRNCAWHYSRQNWGLATMPMQLLIRVLPKSVAMA